MRYKVYKKTEITYFRKEIFFEKNMKIAIK